MGVNIKAHAVEKSTFTITVSFTDEDDQAVTPNSAKWSLTDLQGNTINDRNAVELTPATSINIVMSGDDLVVPIGSTVVHRVLLVEGDYNSNIGSGLPFYAECKFMIDAITKNI